VFGATSTAWPGRGGGFAPAGSSSVVRSRAAGVGAPVDRGNVGDVRAGVDAADR
jgi:hypothetical protein